MCPYYDTNCNTCNFSGFFQPDIQRAYYCLVNAWRGCPEYSGKSIDEKTRKKLRSNPDLLPGGVENVLKALFMK